MHVSMATEKKNHFPRNDDKYRINNIYVVYVNTENKKLEILVPLKLKIKQF